MAQILDPGTGALHVIASRRLQTGAIDSRVWWSQLDMGRIAAETGAIALHVAVLLLLLVPMNPAFEPVVDRHEPPIIFPILPADPPKPPQPPQRVEIQRPTLAPATVPVPQIIEPVTLPLVVDPIPGDAYVEPTPLAEANTTGGSAIAEPLSGAHLEYEFAPSPSYPRDALLKGLTGQVLLRVLVGTDGRPVDVQIERSSGHRVLDVAARRQVAKWRFKPALQDGQPVQALGLVPIDFTVGH